MISALHGGKRLSTDLDFLVNPEGYRKLVEGIRKGKTVLRSPSSIEKMNHIVLGEPRIDRYGIRYPISAGKENRVRLKLEIVAEHSLQLGNCDLIKGKVPVLNRIDKIASKLPTDSDLKSESQVAVLKDTATHMHSALLANGDRSANWRA